MPYHRSYHIYTIIFWTSSEAQYHTIVSERGREMSAKVSDSGMKEQRWGWCCAKRWTVRYVTQFSALLHIRLFGYRHLLLQVFTEFVNHHHPHWRICHCLFFTQSSIVKFADHLAVRSSTAAVKSQTYKDGIVPSHHTATEIDDLLRAIQGKPKIFGHGSLC